MTDEIKIAEEEKRSLEEIKKEKRRVYYEKWYEKNKEKKRKIERERYQLEKKKLGKDAPSEINIKLSDCEKNKFDGIKKEKRQIYYGKWYEKNKEKKKKFEKEKYQLKKEQMEREKKELQLYKEKYGEIHE